MEAREEIVGELLAQIERAPGVAGPLAWWGTEPLDETAQAGEPGRKNVEFPG